MNVPRASYLSPGHVMTVNPFPAVGAVASLPVGFAPLFAGWNVWDIYQADSPDEGVLGTIWHAGISQDELLKTWVVDQVEDNAPGANLSDPLNPDFRKFRGDVVQIIPNAGTLTRAAVRDSIPELASAQQLGTKDSTAKLRTVRFYNRGAQTTMPWPHDQNFLLDATFQPDPGNLITNSPAPSTASGTLQDLGSELGHGLETLAWVVGGAAAVYVLFQLTRKRS